MSNIPKPKYFYEIEGSDCYIYEGDNEDEPVDVIDLHDIICSIYPNAEAI